MSILKKNIIANFVGRGSQALLAIVFTPVYIHFLGIEAYGLIGFYITLQVSLAILELGLKAACAKELSYYSEQGVRGWKVMRDTLRSLEVLYWVMGIIIGVGLLLSGPWIAKYWLGESAIPSNEIRQVFIFIALSIAIRWSMDLYLSALMGIQKQVLLNIIVTTVAVASWAGGALLISFNPNIVVFFQWQLLISIIGTLAMAVSAWTSMPGVKCSANFSLLRLKKMIPFILGTGSNAILSTVLLQADKVILSGILSLQQFGYYVLASMLANGVILLVTPISDAVFPRFTIMLSSKKNALQIGPFYHLANQAAMVIMIPISMVMILFPQDVLFAYTGDLDIAQGAGVVLAILALAKMLHACTLLPYMIQLASGWLTLSVSLNVLSVVWLVPAAYFFGGLYGEIGVALAWLVVTTSYVLIGVPLMHKRLLKGHYVPWLMGDFGRIILSSLILYGVFDWLCQNVSLDRWMQAFVLLIIIFLGVVVAVLISKELRQKLWLRFYVGDKHE